MQQISEMIGEDTEDCKKGRHAPRAAFIKAFRQSHESLLQTVSSLERTKADIIQRLIHTCRFKDNEIGNHILRVGEISRFLAGKAGLSPEDAYRIGIAAPMHDIGKLGIPDSILYKPGELISSEYEILKTHTRIGGNIFRNPNSPEMEYAEAIALYHHERWDGKGYPCGLAGNAIPFSARITAVADVFDVLLSWRTYKVPTTEEKAAEIISRNTGTQFDPLVVAAFTANIDEICRIRNNMEQQPAPWKTSKMG